MQSYNISDLSVSLYFFLLKLCLINTNLRKCADSSYTKSVLLLCCLKLQLSVTQDVLLCMRRQMYFFAFFFPCNCLNINLLKSCTKAVVSDLIKCRFHPSDFNKAVSCSYCEAVDLLWPFVFAWLASTLYHLWSDDDYKLPIVELLSLAFY